MAVPTDVPNLAGWWDASDTATITQAAGKVSQWNDKSGNARHLTQATGTLQPTTGTRTLNALNVLDFQDDELVVPPATLSGAAAATALYVFRDDADPPAFNNGAVLEVWGSSGQNSHEPYSDGVIYHDWGRNARAVLPSSGGVLDTATQITIITSSTEWTYRIGGANHYTTGTNTVGWGANPRVGGTTSFWLRGIVAEICVYSRALNTTERGDIEAYLASKWIAGPISRAVTPATITTTAQPLAVTAGPITLALSPATVTTTGVPVGITIVTPISLALTPATVTVAPVAVLLSIPIVLALTPAQVTVTPVALTLVVRQPPKVAYIAAPPWWSVYVSLTVELGVGRTGTNATRGIWDSTNWDDPTSGTWSGLEPIWTPVDPCRILDLKVQRGRERWIDRYGASSMNITVDDPTGRLSWDADTDPDSLEVRPGTPIRVRALDLTTGVEYPVWRGWIETISDAFTPGYPPPAQLTCQDGFAQVAHVNMPEQSPVGDGETSHARVHRLLDLADWPDEWRDIDFGRITVQGTNLARGVADDLGVTADSEGGALFSDRTDRICFRNRDWLRTAPEASTVQAVIGGPDETVCGAEYELVRDGTDIVNDVQVARAGGTVQRVTAEASISRYRRRSWSRTDYVMETDAQAILLANRILGTRSSGQVRMGTLKVVPTDDLETWAFVLGVDYGWLLEVHYVSEYNPDVSWVRQVHVQGAELSITPEQWELVLTVDDPYATMADTWDGPRGWDQAVWSKPL